VSAWPFRPHRLVRSLRLLLKAGMTSVLPFL